VGKYYYIEKKRNTWENITILRNSALSAKSVGVGKCYYIKKKCTVKKAQAWENMTTLGKSALS
jgi:hypothetical protein